MQVGRLAVPFIEFGTELVKLLAQGFQFNFNTGELVARLFNLQLVHAHNILGMRQFFL